MTEEMPKLSMGKTTNIRTGFNVPQIFRKESQIVINHSTFEQKTGKKQAAEIKTQSYNHGKTSLSQKVCDIEMSEHCEISSKMFKLDI